MLRKFHLCGLMFVQIKEYVEKTYIFRLQAQTSERFQSAERGRNQSDCFQSTGMFSDLNILLEFWTINLILCSVQTFFKLWHFPWCWDYEIILVLADVNQDPYFPHKNGLNYSKQWTRFCNDILWLFQFFISFTHCVFVFFVSRTSSRRHQIVSWVATEELDGYSICHCKVLYLSLLFDSHFQSNAIWAFVHVLIEIQSAFVAIARVMKAPGSLVLLSNSLNFSASACLYSWSHRSSYNHKNFCELAGMFTFDAGLQIAPPEAPVTGDIYIYVYIYAFGKGAVYFADMVSKSANYCYTSPSDPVGVLLLWSCQRYVRSHNLEYICTCFGRDNGYIA